MFTKITVIEVARLLHMPENTVRQQMKIEKLPIGFVSSTDKRGREHYTYHIYLELVLALLPPHLSDKKEALKELEVIRAEIKKKKEEVA